MSKQDKKLQKALAGRTKIGPEAIEKIKRDLDIKSGVREAAKNLGIKIRTGSDGSTRSGGSSRASVTSPSFSSERGLSPAVFDYQAASNLLNQQGNIDTQIANINSEASRYISQLQVGGAKDVARIEGRTDRDVAKIGAKGAVNLQKIVNAGMSRVENIRGEFGIQGKKIEGRTDRDVAKIGAKGAVNLQKIVNAGMSRVENIRGEFGIQGKKIDRNTAILGGLVSAFNF
jgi:hypothetical protein